MEVLRFSGIWRRQLKASSRILRDRNGHRATQQLVGFSVALISEKTSQPGYNSAKRIAHRASLLGRMHMSVGVHKTNASHRTKHRSDERCDMISDANFPQVVFPNFPFLSDLSRHKRRRVTGNDPVHNAKHRAV